MSVYLDDETGHYAAVCWRSENHFGLGFSDYDELLSTMKRQSGYQVK